MSRPQECGSRIPELPQGRQVRDDGKGQIRKTITFEQRLAYLRALVETGNVSFAAERAGVSRAWAYKRRKADVRFDGWCRDLQNPANARLPARVNRDRAGDWTAAKEERFLAALAATRDVPLAARQVGVSAASAYQRLTRRPGFAARCARRWRTTRRSPRPGGSQA